MLTGWREMVRESLCLWSHMYPSVRPDRCIPDGGETVRGSLYLLYPQCSQMCAKTGWREMVSRNNRGACICDLPLVQPDTCVRDEGTITWLGGACICDITCTAQCSQTDMYMYGMGKVVRESLYLWYHMYPQCSQMCVKAEMVNRKNRGSLYLWFTLGAARPVHTGWGGHG